MYSKSWRLQRGSESLQGTGKRVWEAMLSDMKREIPADHISVSAQRVILEKA
jgi:hypothetical protein